MRLFIRHIVIVSVCALLVSGVLIGISGWAQSTDSANAQFRYDSLREQFIVNGILHSDAKKFFIGGEVLDIRSHNPFLAIANNLIFTSISGAYSGPQSIAYDRIITPLVTQDQPTTLTVQSPTAQLVLGSGRDTPVQVISNDSISVPRGVSVGASSGLTTDFSIRAPSVRATELTSLDASPLRVSAGIVRLDLPPSNTIDGLYWFRTGAQNPVADSQPLCVTMPAVVGYVTTTNASGQPIIVARINKEVAQPSCPADTPFLLDAALSLNKIICCNACALSGLPSSYTQQACSDQVRLAMPPQ